MKTAILSLTAILVGLIAASWGWAKDTLLTFEPLQRYLIAAAFTVLIFGALAWSLYPIVWDWAAWIGLI